MLAYVFWHWKQHSVAADNYEQRQRAFHTALAFAPPSGFLGSRSAALSGAPWAAGSRDAYEDWYMLQDFAALGELNEAAVSASRTVPHDAAAAVAADGAGGVYGLRGGSAVQSPQYAHWFSKPHGITYREVYTELAPVVEDVNGALWLRQMVLGPAREFCLHATAPLVLPAVFDVLIIPLRQVWPIGD